MQGGLIFFLRRGEGREVWVGVWVWRLSVRDRKPEDVEAVLLRGGPGAAAAAEHTSTEWRRGSSNQDEGRGRGISRLRPPWVSTLWNLFSCRRHGPTPTSTP